MSAITTRLSNSVHESIKILARQGGIFVNRRVAGAAAQTMASSPSLDDQRRQAALAKREAFDQYLKLVPSVPPQDGDEVAATWIGGRH